MSTRRMPAAERKKQIMMSAIRVFARSTYHGATTKNIAEEAGVTEALLYRYFGSKREIFKEGIRHTAGRITRGLEEILKENEHRPMQAIWACADYFVAILESHHDLARMIFLVLAEMDQEDVREAYLPYQKRALNALKQSLLSWQEKGYVDPELNVDDAAWLFFGSYILLAQLKQSHGAVRLDPKRVMGLIRPYFTEKGQERFEELSASQT